MPVFSRPKSAPTPVGSRASRFRVRESSYLVGVIVLVALVLRLFGNGFGLPHLYYWDEPTVVNRAMRFGSGDLNPHFFYYPSLYMYVLFVACGGFFVVGRMTGHFQGVDDFVRSFFLNPTEIYLVCRSLTALVGAATVYLAYRVGERWFGQRVGILSAAVLAVSTVHATNSHIAITDVPHSFFIVAACLPLKRILERAHARDYVLCGMLIGLGVATKYMAVVLLAPAFLAHVVGHVTVGKRSLWLLGALCLTSALGFLVGSPFNVLDYRTFLADIRQQMVLSAGGQGTSYQQLLLSDLPAALGWPLLLLALAGMLGMLRAKSWQGIILLLFPVLYIILTGRSALTFPRYIIPMEPFFAFGAAWAMDRTLIHLKSKVQHRRLIQAASLVFTGLLLVPTYYLLRWDIMMATEPDSRTLALRWIHDNIPSQSRVVVQPLYNRTFENVPVMTDRRLATLLENIPPQPRFEGVRQALIRQAKEGPYYREVPYVADLASLRQAGAEYIFVSGTNLRQLQKSQAERTDPEWRLIDELNQTAEKVALFAAPTNLETLLPPGVGLALPVLPPTITIYRLTPTSKKP